MLPDTFDVRKKAGIVSDDRLSGKLAYMLVNSEVTSEDEIEDNALIVDEMRVALCGQSYSDEVRDELNEQIGALTRTTGLVYDKLPDGYSLCTARLRVAVTSTSGASMVVAKNARFASQDPDVVAAYRLEPQVQRLTSTMERLAHVIEEDVARIPALATRTPGMLLTANSVMQRELPAPAPSNGPNGNTP